MSVGGLLFRFMACQAKWNGDQVPCHQQQPDQPHTEQTGYKFIILPPPPETTTLGWIHESSWLHLVSTTMGLFVSMDGLDVYQILPFHLKSKALARLQDDLHWLAYWMRNCMSHCSFSWWGWWWRDKWTPCNQNTMHWKRINTSLGPGLRFRALAQTNHHFVGHSITLTIINHPASPLRFCSSTPFVSSWEELGGRVFVIVNNWKRSRQSLPTNRVETLRIQVHPRHDNQPPCVADFDLLFRPQQVTMHRGSESDAYILNVCVWDYPCPDNTDRKTDRYSYI